MNRWTTKPLSEIAQVFNGKTPAKTEQRTIGHPVLKIRDVDEVGGFRGRFESFVDPAFADAHATKKVNTADVLILNAAHNADYVGSKIFFANQQVAGALATGEWAIIRANPAFLNPGFVHHWVRSQIGRTTIKGLVRGIHLYPSDIAGLAFPVVPLADQERIVKLLDEADELRKLRSQADRRTADLIPALFHEMFGDPATNPFNWRAEYVGDLFDQKRGGAKCGPFGSALKKNEYVEAGIPVWGIPNILPNQFIEEGSLFISPAKFEELRAYSIESGDLLLSRAGTVGRICVARPRVKASIMGTNLIRLALDQQKVVPDFFSALMTHFAKDVGRLRANSDEGAYSFMNTTVLRALRIYLPPLQLQKEFASLVTGIRELEAKQAASRERLDALFQSMLHRAFRGEL